MADRGTVIPLPDPSAGAQALIGTALVLAGSYRAFGLDLALVIGGVVLVVDYWLLRLCS